MSSEKNTSQTPSCIILRPGIEAGASNGLCIGSVLTLLRPLRASTSTFGCELVESGLGDNSLNGLVLGKNVLCGVGASILEVSTSLSSSVLKVIGI